MAKKVFAVATIILLAFGATGAFYLLDSTHAASLFADIQSGGLVEKKPGESFTVKIAFENRGKASGAWRIAVTLEGEDWSWIGNEKQLFLKPHQRHTLKWNGAVPAHAHVDSVSRLIVYSDDGFVRLNWWIHVTAAPVSELCIVDSEVT